MSKIIFYREVDNEPVEIDNTDFVPSNILLAAIESVKKESYLDDNISNENIRTAMLFIQDSIVERVTGSCLMNQLKQLIGFDLIDEDEFLWYRQLLDEYLFKIICQGVQSDLASHLTFKERNQGIVRNNDINLSYPILDEVKYIKGQYDRKLDFYINRSVKWLSCNSEHFKELCGSYGCCDCETAPYNKPYSVGVNLNIERNNNKNKFLKL